MQQLWRKPYGTPNSVLDTLTGTAQGEGLGGFSSPTFGQLGPPLIFFVKCTHARLQHAHKDKTFAKFLLYFQPFKGLKFQTIKWFSREACSRPCSAPPPPLQNCGPCFSFMVSIKLIPQYIQYAFSLSFVLTKCISVGSHWLVFTSVSIHGFYQVFIYLKYSVCAGVHLSIIMRQCKCNRGADMSW